MPGIYPGRWALRKKRFMSTCRTSPDRWLPEEIPLRLDRVSVSSAVMYLKIASAIRAPAAVPTAGIHTLPALFITSRGNDYFE